MDEPIRVLQCVTIMNRNGLENRLMDIYRNIDRSVIQFSLTHQIQFALRNVHIQNRNGRIF